MSKWMDWSEWNATVEKMERHAAYMGQILGDPNTLPTHRIRDLRLVGHAQSILPALSSLPRDAFPLLERLHIRILVDEDWVKKLDKAPSIVAFAESTRLWHLRLEDRIPDFFFTHLYQRSLTDVNLSLYEPIPSELVLGQCTQLERLHINSLTSFRRLFDKDFDLVTLDRLKFLSLRGTDCYLLAPKLSTPSLESFSCSDADDVPASDILSFLERAPRIDAFALEWVSFESTSTGAGFYTSLLRRLPQVKRLTLVYIPGPMLQGIFEALPVLPGVEILPQDLRDLELCGGVGHWHVGSIDCLMQRVRSELQPRRYVCRVIIDGTGRQDSISEMLQELSNEGFQVWL